MFAPACAPDGRSIAFSYNRRRAQAGLWVVGLEDGRESLLLPRDRSDNPVRLWTVRNYRAGR